MPQTRKPALTVQQAQVYLAAMSPEERLAFNAKRNLDAERLREELSSMSFYAERARAAEARTGDPLSYWRGLMTSQVNRFSNR